jgi:hypothetical protein
MQAAAGGAAVRCRASSRAPAQPQRCRASAGDAAPPAPLRRRAALAGAAAALLAAGSRVSSARAAEEDAAAASPLVAEMLRRSAANKEANDKARRNYSKQYSGCVRRALGTHAHNRFVTLRCYRAAYGLFRPLPALIPTAT